jgi:hypothetical protein
MPKVFEFGIEHIFSQSLFDDPRICTYGQKVAQAVDAIATWVTPASGSCARSKA